MTFIEDDGGRELAGYKGKTGDCVTRAIAIATGLPYHEVYDGLYLGIREHSDTRNDKVARKIREGNSGSTPRNGVYKPIYKKYLNSIGWKFTPTMSIGSGCKVHLRADELPKGRLIVSVSKHMVAVIDGVIHDTYDPSREGTRCVYGYFIKVDIGLTDEVTV